MHAQAWCGCRDGSAGVRVCQEGTMRRRQRIEAVRKGVTIMIGRWWNLLEARGEVKAQVGGRGCEGRHTSGENQWA